MSSRVVPSRHSLQSGFTLVEVLVSLALFMVVVTISVGTMIVLIDANEKARTEQSLMNNVSFALDSMTREIRQGSDYRLSGGTFSFTEGGGSLTADCGNQLISYRLRGAAIEQSVCGNWSAVTSSEVTITDLGFTLAHADPTDGRSPLVTIVVTGEAADSTALDSTFSLQTTVTQRTLDLPSS